ncbi:MAG: hypothetical protein ACK6DC_23305 [Planctomycetota bacterium]|jgi:hypothetical protein
MSKQQLEQAKVTLENAQDRIPWILSIVLALGSVVPGAILFRDAFGVVIGLLLGLSVGLGLSSVAVACTNAILAILEHLLEQDAKP